MTARVYLTSVYARQKAHRLLDEAPPGFVMDIREPTRTDSQNSKLHAMVQDIIDQVPGAEQFSKEEWKLRFMHALRNETKFLPELDGGGMFPVGQKTSTLNVTQFNALIEIIYEWGARHEVQWSDPAERYAA